MTRPVVRVVAAELRGQRGDLAGLSGLIREAGPDVAVLTGAPWRLRTRPRAADLAVRSGLFAAAGSASTLGNVILVNLRVDVHDTWCVQFPLVPGQRLCGAVLARCSLGPDSFVVAGTRLSGDGPQRARQAEILTRVLSEVDEPLVLAGDLAGTELARNLLEAAGGVYVGPGVGVAARHYARRGRATAPIMVDLLLPAGAAAGTASI
jgi:endonuclease/exonuclease/phosphatase family metal-dependent hydrolase